MISYIIRLDFKINSQAAKLNTLRITSNKNVFHKREKHKKAFFVLQGSLTGQEYNGRTER